MRTAKENTTIRGAIIYSVLIGLVILAACTSCAKKPITEIRVPVTQKFNDNKYYHGATFSVWRSGHRHNLQDMLVAEGVYRFEPCDSIAVHLASPQDYFNYELRINNRQRGAGLHTETISAPGQIALTVKMSQFFPKP